MESKASRLEIDQMNDVEYNKWISQVGAVVDISAPSEENLIALISEALRETDKDAKARGFADVANMCLALADVTLGAQDYVAQCIVLERH